MRQTDDLNEIRADIRDLRREIHPTINISDEVQHSIIWASALLLLALIIKWITV